MAVDRKRVEEALGGFAPPGAGLDAAGAPPVPQAEGAPSPTMAQEGIQEGMEGGPPVGGMMPEEGTFMPNDMTPEEQEQFKAMLALAARQRLAGI